MTDIFKGATDQSRQFELVDSTTGLPKTGIVYTDVTGSYSRTRSARVAITMATLASASAAHADGGFILIDDTNQPGIYRFDIPDAAFATGAEEVVITVKATGCRTVSRQFNLVNINNQVAYVPNAAADAAGGLPISDAGGLDLDSKLANTNEVTAARMGALTDWINGGRLDLILDIIAADTTTDIPTLIAALNDISTVEVNGVLEAYRTNGVASDNDAQSILAGNVQINGVVDSIYLDTVNIGTNGAGLNSIPWNAAWDSQVESECTDALTAFLTSDGAMSPGDERSPTDTNPITFSFPTFGAEITGQVSKNNAAYAACVGAFAFLRTEDSKHWYTLAFNAADRPAAEGTARYVFTDGIDTVYVTLRVAAAALDTVAQSQLDKVEATTAGTTTGAGTATEVFTGTNATVTVNLDNDDNRTSVVVS